MFRTPKNCSIWLMAAWNETWPWTGESLLKLCTFEIFWGVMLRVPTYYLCQEVICIQNRPWQFRGDGTVSLEELVYGVGRLKGPARSQDVEPKQQKRTCHCTFCPGAVHVLVFFWFGVADKHDQSRPRHVSWKKSKTWKDCCCNKVHETKPCTLLHQEAKRPSKAVCV